MTLECEAREHRSPSLSSFTHTHTHSHTHTGSGQIVAVRGDLTLPQFGMVNFETIARETSLVIHCGSFVNHIFNYSNLKAANVGGTMNAIELATYNRASVVYISTISVLPNKLSLARNSETEIAGSMSYLNKAGG